MIINVFKCTNGEYIKVYDVSDDTMYVNIAVTFCESPFYAHQFPDVVSDDMKILNERISGKFVHLKLVEL